MRKTFIVLFLLLILTQQVNATQDGWIAKDKLLHIIHSAALVGLSYHIYHCQFRNPEYNSKVFAASFTGICGFAKELHDGKKESSKFSAKDMVANFIGIGIGILIFAQ